MGNERKSRKRRSSLSPSIDDDKDRARKFKKRDGEKEKKTRKEEDKERKKRRRDKKSREHSDSREGKEGKTRERHKHRRKQADKEGFKELSDEDYFSKNNEFSTWLKEERGIYFSDLSSEAARDLFSSFIKAWNKQKLQPWYYEGIASAPRTAHNWKIKHDK
ncbi:hypothetical protein IEQ34_017894 [Dendrobium chrysotoxum]|uniref:Uncharacterized protein n=1 Tax=Dendrobium chrysotoxum TaxID=161865 RepID=A0AAV7FV29_DENCH|nr:hypothetical protein IEQ34_017894 [Dendrobium chrysotoxum]